jgi:hypothetical protein
LYYWRWFNIIGARPLLDVVVVVHVQVQVHPPSLTHVVFVVFEDASRPKRAWTSFALSIYKYQTYFKNH